MIVRTVRVFDDDAHSHLPVIVVGRSEDPDARIVHLHDDIGAFRNVELQLIDHCLCRHGVAVEGDNAEAMTG